MVSTTGATFPYFFGSLELAKKQAEEEGKFLFVNIHNPYHELTESFLSSENCVLRDDAVGKDQALWGQIRYGSIDLTSSDGSSLVSRLEIVSYPAAVLLWKHSVVTVLQGPNLLSTAHTEHEIRTAVDGGWGTVAANDIVKLTERRSAVLQQQAQEAAEEESERIDRERLAEFDRKRLEEEAIKRRRDEEAEAAASEAREKARAEAEALIKAEREAQEQETALQLQRSLALSRLPTEPSADDSSKQDVVLVSFRLPKRQYERRFVATDSIETLYDFVESTDDFSGKPFSLMESGIRPKPVVREDRSLADALGKQKRVLLLYREL